MNNVHKIPIELKASGTRAQGFSHSITKAANLTQSDLSVFGAYPGWQDRHVSLKTYASSRHETHIQQHWSYKYYSLDVTPIIIPKKIFHWNSKKEIHILILTQSIDVHLKVPNSQDTNSELPEFITFLFPCLRIFPIDWQL